MFKQNHNYDWSQAYKCVLYNTYLFMHAYTTTRIFYGPGDRIFSSHWTIIIDSFSCILFLRQQHLSLHVCYHCQFYTKISTFSVRKCLRRHLPSMLTLERLVENDIKNWCCDVKRRPDVMHESRLTPTHVRQHFLALVEFTEIPVGYARKGFPWFLPVLDNFRLTWGGIRWPHAWPQYVKSRKEHFKKVAISSSKW